MTVMRSRPVWTTDLVAFLLGAGMYSSFIVLPQFVETSTGTGFGFGASVTGAGLFMVPLTIAMMVIGPLAGPLQGRFGSRLPLIVGCGFAATAFGMLAVAHSQSWEVYVAAALLGIGIGLAFAAMANLIVEAVPPDQTGVATGVNTITRTVGGAFGGQIVATIISGGGSPTESSFVLAFAVIAASLVLSILAALAIPRSPTGRERAVAHGELVGAESA
jgi:MFS family permease